MKKTILLISLILLSSFTVADTNETIEEPLFEETEVDLGEMKEALEEEDTVPSFVISFAERFIPEQRMNIEFGGELSEEFYEDLAEEEDVEPEVMEEVIEEDFLPENNSASITLDSDIETLEVNPEVHEDPNTEVTIDMVVVEDMLNESTPTKEDFIDYYKEDKIEVETSGIRNRIFLRVIESVVL